jgi:hypothetical protein
MNGLNASQLLTKQIAEISYAYYDYDRQYHESYGAGHDGNSPHRLTPVRREETA